METILKIERLDLEASVIKSTGLENNARRKYERSEAQPEDPGI